MYLSDSTKEILTAQGTILRSFKSFIGTTVFSLGLTSMFTDISSEMISSILPVYLMLGVGITPFQYGIIDGLYQGASVFVRLIGGFISDKFQRPKEIATAGYVFSMLSKIGFLVGQVTFVSAGYLILLDRLGKGIRTPSRDALIAHSSSEKKMATSFGIHRAMDTLGAFAGPLIATIILSTLAGSYNLVFMTSLVFAILGVLVILLFVPSVSAITDITKRIQWADIVSLKENRLFSILVVFSMLFAFITISDGFIYLTLQRQFDLSSQFFPLLYVVTALVFMITAIPVGKLADKIGKHKVLLGGYVLLLFVYVLLVSGLTHELIVYLVLFLLGFYYSATDGVLVALVSPHLPLNIKATGLAFVSTVTGAAKLISSIFFGYFWNTFGLMNSLQIYMFILGISLVVFLYIYPRFQSPTSHGK